MDLFLGVDGGQSSTVALIGDETGRITGVGRGAACRYGGAVEEAVRAAGATGVTFAAACFGFSGGAAGKETLARELVNADRYTPTGPDQIPTGEIASVEGTPLDFRQMMPIGARLHSAFPQMVYAHGYDHNFVLNQRPGDSMMFAARAYDPRSGRLIDLSWTPKMRQVAKVEPCP